MTFAAAAATAGTAAAVATAGLAVGNVLMDQKALSEQKKARRSQQAIQTAQQTRQRMEQVRQQRIAQAQIQQAASTQGTQESSSARGGMGAVGSRVAGNLGFSQGIQNVQESIAQRLEKANQYQSNAQGLRALANLSMQAQNFNT